MWLSRCLGAALAVLAAAGVAIAAPATAPARPAPPPLDPKAVEAWADATVIPAMQKSGVPGALVVVVRRNGVVLSKGYGYADVARKIPVRADTTQFDIASIGKSMTAVVTEQLLDEGKLNLDEDINHYLKSAKVTGPKVTLRMLLGHRAGFDGDLTGLFVPLGQDIHVPTAELNRRLRPDHPGTRPGYDNQGYGVIGLILHDVTGKPLSQLYRERLYGPAGMKTAEWGQPSNPSHLANCYVVHGPGKLRQCTYWLYRDAAGGAGGTAATADDMAAYMRMLLNGGVADGRQVLSPRAYADLTNFDNYRFHPGMPGAGRAFVQFEEMRGLEYAHSGHMPGFSSMMEIYPEADVAVFTSFMGGPVGSYDTNLTSILQAMDDSKVEPKAKPGMATMDRLNDLFAAKFIPAVWPRSEGSQPPVSSAPERLDDFIGTYLSGERSRSFQMRIMAMLETMKIERAGPDAVKVMGLTFKRIRPYLYEEKTGKRLAFAARPDGRYVAIGLSPGQFRKTNWLETPAWTVLLFPVTLLILLTGLIQLRPRASDRLRSVAGLSLLGAVAVIAGLLLEWQFAVPLAVVKGAVILPALWRLALNLGAGLLVWAAARFFLRRSEPVGWVSYAHGTLIAVAGLALFVILALWKVLLAFPPYVSW